MKVTSHAELTDLMLGPIGTPDRDRHEIRHLFWRVAFHIKQRRREFNFSQEDIAQRTGLSVTEIKSIERGAVKTPIPKIHMIWKQLGIGFDGTDFGYYQPHWTLKEKPTLKKKLTKPSTTLRTIVR